MLATLLAKACNQVPYGGNLRGDCIKYPHTIMTHFQHSGIWDMIWPVSMRFR